MLLLHMGVKRGIREISFVAVFALEVSASIVVFGASLSTLFGGVHIIIIRYIVRILVSLAWIVMLLVLFLVHQ